MKTIILTSRGVILHEGKILTVKHAEGLEYYALPGGKVEYGEGPVLCLKREIKEELNIEPVVGRLLYVNTFVRKEEHHVDFIFEIKNGKDFFKANMTDGTHSHEIHKILWMNKGSSIKLLPEAIAKDFKSGQILSDVVRFI